MRVDKPLLWAKRKVEGLCVSCGVEPATEKSYNCSKCSLKKAKITKARRDERAAKGLCSGCGKRPFLTGSFYCDDCRIRRNKAGSLGARYHFFITASTMSGRQKRDRVLALGLWNKWKTQRGRCALTGERLTADNSAIDHILPVSRGGTHQISNLRWLTRDVNYSKGALTDIEFFSLCESVLKYKDKA